MNFKTQQTLPLATGKYLDEIFPCLPSNAFIDKGACGNGGTTLEITNILRCSIIIVPNVTIVKQKHAKHPEMQMVYADISVQTIQEFLRSKLNGLKIISTPDGIKKVMKAANDNGMLTKVYKQWFLLLDESHCFSTENYRPGILAPFDYFYKFKSKTMISATPYLFSDPRMRHLNYIKIKIQGVLGTINMVNASNVNATLELMIKDSLADGFQTFIFYNSVRQIKELIKSCELIDCNVYCADNKDKKNRTTLGEYEHMMKEGPVSGSYAPTNFITTTGFEGWDLETIEKVRLIVATDVTRGKEHTAVGINKCFQALGRWRTSIDSKGERPELYHVYNHRNINSMYSIEQVYTGMKKEASRIIRAYNSRETRISFSEDPRLRRLCKDPDVSVKLDHNMLDQYVNESYNNGVFNHRDFIKEAWEGYNYEVVLLKSDAQGITQTRKSRMSKPDQLRQDYELIWNHHNDSDKYTLDMDPAVRLMKSNPTAVQAYILLTKEIMEELQYNVPKVKAEIIKAENTNNTVKLHKMVGHHFTLYQVYSRKKIKELLQSIYNELGLTTLKATAEHIKKFFEVGTCSTKFDGRTEHCFKILRPTLSIRLTH